MSGYQQGVKNYMYAPTAVAKSLSNRVEAE